MDRRAVAAYVPAIGARKGSMMQSELVIRESPYYCYLDEKNFFAWLESISAVKSVAGGPKGLTIEFVDAGLARDDWADLLGLFARYGIDMAGLRDLVTPEHEAWLKDPDKYWHARLWGPPGSLLGRPDAL
jgi:hypothetical protein